MLARACGIALTALQLASAAAAGDHPPIPAGGSCLARQCHARLLERAGGPGGRSAHPPAVDGDCASCHDLALPGEGRFVKGAPARGDDGPDGARAWDLSLCTGCHGEALAAREAGAGATRFADGRKNLHALHVQAGRGRRCLVCHDPHAAEQPRLLRGRIPARAGVLIAQEFRVEPRGGWCRTGCHAPKRFER